MNTITPSRRAALRLATSVFEAGPITPSLRQGEIHVWKADLSSAAPTGFRWLSEEEKARAQRFHFAADQARFVAARVAIRSILGRYLQVSPGEIRFRVGPAGKPSLASPTAALRFNLSHSGNLLVLGLTMGREIGVDVEIVSPEFPFEGLFAECLPPRESARVRSLPSEDRAQAYYRLWTRMEAQLKAEGTGLGAGMAVPDPARWSDISFSPAAGYVAAIAVERGAFELKCWSWLN